MRVRDVCRCAPSVQHLRGVNLVSSVVSESIQTLSLSQNIIIRITSGIQVLERLYRCVGSVKSAGDRRPLKRAAGRNSKLHPDISVCAHGLKQEALDHRLEFHCEGAVWLSKTNHVYG